MKSRSGAIVLEDGSVFYGKGFGATGTAVGEVVFTTSMVGYTESLTDPSYRGQILLYTYPLIGNYGVPPKGRLDEFGLPLGMESHRIQVQGLIVHELCEAPSHWSSGRTLDQWLRDEGVPGVQGVDTRLLTLKLREHGVMMGAMGVFEGPPDIELLRRSLERSQDYGTMRLVELVSVKEPVVFGEGRRTVVLYDTGVKLSIIRELMKRQVRVVVVPHDTPLDDAMSWGPDGFLFSNGPGNPEVCVETTRALKAALETGIPVFGICLGAQILALALGGSTYKLPYGHRGINKGVVDRETGALLLTSQNHGYAIRRESLDGTGLVEWYTGIDDNTVEGIRHRSHPAFAVQFHPEASPGPRDVNRVFDMFVRLMEDPRWRP